MLIFALIPSTNISPLIRRPELAQYSASDQRSSERSQPDSSYFRPHICTSKPRRSDLADLGDSLTMAGLESTFNSSLRLGGSADKSEIERLIAENQALKRAASGSTFRYVKGDESKMRSKGLGQIPSCNVPVHR